jgi:hypothetical protein
MRSADARLSASTMISSSMRFSLVGAQVDCTTKTSRARTFCLISTVTSPSEKRPTWAAPRVVPRCWAISAAKLRIGIAGENHEVGLVGLHERPSSLKKMPCAIRTLAGEKGFEPLHAGIKIRCLNQLGDSPTQVIAEAAINRNSCLLPILPEDESSDSHLFDLPGRRGRFAKINCM